MSVQALTCAMATRGVSPSEKLLLLALANYADENMRCWPSQKRLADDTCLSDRTVRTLLASLEERRMISRQERTRNDGSRATDIITLHFYGAVVSTPDAEISRGAEIISGGVGKPFPGGAETASALTTFEPSPEPIKLKVVSEANASGGEPPDPNARAWRDGVDALVALGGMKQQAARTFFGRLLKDHGIEARDLLSPIGQLYNQQSGDPQAFLKAAAKRRDRRSTGPPKRVGFV